MKHIATLERELNALKVANEEDYANRQGIVIEGLKEPVADITA